MTHSNVDVAPGAVVLVERTIAAPIDQVFAAWLDPGTLARWISPTGRAQADVDPRVGGRFRVVMLGGETEPAPDGGIEHVGEYLEIERDRRLAFTWQSAYTGPLPTRVTVDLEPAGEGTRLVLTHELLPEEAIESHRGGWRQIVEQLARLLESQPAGRTT